MKQLTNGKIISLCMGDFARGMINGIITTYLLTFFIPTNANTTLPQFFLNAALIMAIIRRIRELCLKHKARCLACRSWS